MEVTMARNAGFVVGIAVLGGLAALARADEGWDDERASRLGARVAAHEATRSPEAATGRPAAAADPAAVDLEHGDARFVGEIARVDVTLDVTNRTGQVMEWARTVAIDPQAEVIGASLQRAGGEPVSCRTLPLEDARRIYGEARGPRPTPGAPGRDPLRLERERDEALRIVVFPIAPQERVRILVTFATALRGRDDLRTYVSPIGGFLPAEESPQRPSDTALPPMETVLVVHPGSLTFVPASPEVVPAGSAGAALRFHGAAEAPSPLALPTASGRISFAVPRGERRAIAVRGGGFGTRIALWRFDPAAFLRAHDIEPTPDLRLRLVGTRGTQRVAPDTFAGTDEPATVSARLLPALDAAWTVVEVVDPVRGGVASIPFAAPVERTTLDEPLEDAVIAWHLSRLARRALAWAGDDSWRRSVALGFAVDAGVLVPGTAALAVPENEQRWLPRASRRQYLRDGKELGGDADWIGPPSGVR
jgi:hypothetical protein